jgi:hypothetical protein
MAFSFSAHSQHQMTRKTKWSHEEDEALCRAVEVLGTSSWSRLASLIPNRNGKQCRERWVGQLSPNVSKENWLPLEDARLLRLHAMNGNNWTAMTRDLPGRSPLNIKNRWHWLKRRRAPATAGNPLPTVTIPIIQHCDVVETPKQCQTVFEPLPFDNGVFGNAFQEFRQKMFHGINSRYIK